MSQADLGFKPTKIYKPTGKVEFVIPAQKVETPWWDFWSTNPSTGTTAITPTPVAPTSTISTTPPKVPQGMWSGKDIGGTMQGIGAVAGAIGSMMAVYETKKYNKKSIL